MPEQVYSYFAVLVHASIWLQGRDGKVFELHLHL